MGSSFKDERGDNHPVGSDAEHYARVRRQYAELAARGEAEGWHFEYLSEIEAYNRSSELVGKLVADAYWARHGTPTHGVEHPAYMYRHMFKTLKDVQTNSPVTGFKLVFEDGSEQSLCYTKVCVATRSPEYR